MTVPSLNIDPEYKPKKTYQQLLEEGLPNKGGLRQLAYVEQMANQQRSTVEPRQDSTKVRSHQNCKYASKVEF